jgi:membrane protease YdiL (CAAX protease family)
MPFLTFLAFLLLGASFLSLWVRRDPKIWGTLLGLSMLCGLAAGNIGWIGLLFVILLGILWIVYHHKPNVALFLLLMCASSILKMRLLPGYTPFFFTPRFAIGLEGSLIGLFPLAFLVPLSRDTKDWGIALKGLIFGCVGIVMMAMLATLSGATHWQFKLPSFIAARTLSNFFLTSMPEEGFYRGFIQTTLCKYFKNIKLGNPLALLLTSTLFTAAHMYWSPNMQILIFVFLASLLYGGVYLISGKIESPILCHFLLNFIHMILFSYHAM